MNLSAAATTSSNAATTPGSVAQFVRRFRFKHGKETSAYRAFLLRVLT
jgi:hypothetical protein